MAVAEPWTEVHDTPNKSVRQNVPRRGVVLHHAAMTNLDELIRLEMGAKQLSSTATCKDNRLPRMMPLDTYRAWSLSDAYWDSALRSVETCNESTVGWTVSDASHWSLARMVAYLAQRDGFWPHRDGDPKTWTVIGHREVYTIHGGSYGTACPGGMDIGLVTTRAQGLLKTAPIEQQGDIIMRYFWAPNRGGMTTTETDGVFFPANAEEAQALSDAYAGVDVTTRAWDVLRQAALNRQAAADKVERDGFTLAVNAAFDTLEQGGNVDIDEAALAALLAAELAAKGITAEVDANELATVFLNAQAARLAE